MTDPLFSIITITCNNLDGLKRTRESLFAQTYTGYEWIIIDGASVDGTTEYLKELAANWSSEPDDGIYDAMNKGIDRASGAYVTFLNAGDIFAGPDILENLKWDMEKQANMPDFIYGDSLEGTGRENTAYKTARSHEKAEYGLFTHHQAMLYRRDKIASLRYDLKYKIAADYKFTLQFLKQCDHVLYCPYALCLFECGGVSQTQAKNGRIEQFNIRAEEKTVSLAKNIFIYFFQSAVMALRKFMPGLYWKLKQK